MQQDARTPDTTNFKAIIDCLYAKVQTDLLPVTISVSGYYNRAAGRTGLDALEREIARLGDAPQADALRRTADLYAYIQHLESNGQTAQKHEIEFWRKVFYPLSCVVMLVLALPFAYLHFRSGSIAGYVFIGVMVGISFFLLNEVFGFLGRLHQWWPWLTAAVPSLLYTLASLTAFGWLVLRR